MHKTWSLSNYYTSVKKSLSLEKTYANTQSHLGHAASAVGAAQIADMATAMQATSIITALLGLIVRLNGSDEGYGAVR